MVSGLIFAIRKHPSPEWKVRTWSLALPAAPASVSASSWSHLPQGALTFPMTVHFCPSSPTTPHTQRKQDLTASCTGLKSLHIKACEWYMEQAHEQVHDEPWLWCSKPSLSCLHPLPVLILLHCLRQPRSPVQSSKSRSQA